MLDESWDVLVVLDACRYDALAAENPFDAPCQERVSRASNTHDWFPENFGDDPRTETLVYVTANPVASSEAVPASRFHHLEEVFEYGWDDDGSVEPALVTNKALQLHSEHPDKRLVVHYMQPHGPLIGTDRPNLHDDRYGSLRNGDVSRETVVETYRECLRYALEDVERLVDHVSGEVAITADHGESFGTAGIYGHPPWANAHPLLTVPWIETTGGERPIPDSVLQSRNRSASDSDLDEKLRSLGYLN